MLAKEHKAVVSRMAHVLPRPTSHATWGLALALACLVYCVCLAPAFARADELVANDVVSADVASADPAPSASSDATAPALADQVTANADPADPAVPTHGIPVISITLQGEGAETPAEAFDAVNASSDHSVERSGALELHVPQGYRGDYSDVPLQDLSVGIETFRGRGNSTWRADKKPYKVKLAQSADLLGMGANKHWVLLANPIDTSSLRNRLASYMGSQLGLEFTPKMLPVDLVVNGSYHGCYYLTEQVRVETARVNIDKLKPTDAADPEITGGYLIAMTPKRDEPQENRITTNGGVQFCGEDPDFGPDGSGTSEQKAYIANYLQAVEDAIYGEDFADANGVPWTDYMDMASAARYWWVQEFAMNSTDAYWTPSTYLYKRRDGKLYWGPLWDFDQSMRGRSDGLASTTMPWLDYLRSFDPSYQAELRDAWAQLDAILADIVREGGILDQYAAEMDDAWQADFDRWVRDTPSGPYAQSFAQEVESLRAFFSERRAWINDNIDEQLTRMLCKVTFEVDGEVVGNEVTRVNSNVDSLPSWPQRDGQVFLGWMAPDGSEFTRSTMVENSLTVTARYADAADVALGESIYLNPYDVGMGLDDQTYTTKFTIVPDGAAERYASWASSNPDVAVVDAYGIATAHGVGETTITATLASGASASYVLHVVESSSDLPWDVESIKLDRQALELAPGEFGQVRVTVLPQANEYSVPKYRCEDQSVATVDDNGVVKAVAEGTTNVIVCFPGYEDEWPSASYQVVVRKADTDPESGEDSGDDPGADTDSDDDHDTDTNPSPGDDSGDDSSSNPGKNPGDDSGSDPGKTPGDGSANNPSSDSGKTPGDDSGNNPGSDSGAGSGSGSGTDSGTNPGPTSTPSANPGSTTSQSTTSPQASGATLTTAAPWLSRPAAPTTTAKPQAQTTSHTAQATPATSDDVSPLAPLVAAVASVLLLCASVLTRRHSS